MRAAWIRRGARVSRFGCSARKWRAVSTRNATFLEALSGRDLHEETERSGAAGGGGLYHRWEKNLGGVARANTTKGGCRRKTSPASSLKYVHQTMPNRARWVKLRAREITRQRGYIKVNYELLQVPPMDSNNKIAVYIVRLPLIYIYCERSIIPTFLPSLLSIFSFLAIWKYLGY